MIVFRAEKEYQEGNDLLPEDLNSTTKLSVHVSNGSETKNKRKVKSKYISTSTKIAVVSAKYAYGFKGDPNSKIPQVLLIDLPESITRYDFSDDEVVKRIKLDSFAANCAKADREVTVEGIIPKESIKTIPLPIVDILVLLEGNEKTQGIYDEILKKIFDGKITNEAVTKLLDNMKFNSLERRFVNRYYNAREAQYKCANEFFPKPDNKLKFNQDDLIKALNIEIIKKIIINEDFVKLIMPDAALNKPNMVQEYVKFMKNISEKLYGISERKIHPTAVDSKKMKFYGETFKICTEKDFKVDDKDKLVVYGMDYKYKDDNESDRVVSACMLYSRIVKDPKDSKKEIFNGEDTLVPKILISRSTDIPVIEKEQLKNVIVQARKRERGFLRRFIIGKVLGKDVQAKVIDKESKRKVQVRVTRKNNEENDR